MRRDVLIAWAMLALGTGCATAPIPRPEMEHALSEILHAERLGARDDTSAGFDLEHADSEFYRANECLVFRDTACAKSYAIRSVADAEVAVARAHERQVRNALKRVLTRAAELETKLERIEGPAFKPRDRAPEEVKR